MPRAASKPLDVVPGHLYDFPKYYDLIFGSDWRAEYHFLKQVFAQFAKRPVKKLFEPGCGTGRLMVKFAQDGYEISGIDLNEHAVKFCNDRLARKGLPATATVGDMSDFSVPRKVDAAFNMINTFRHLPTEESATSHLQCVARALAKGGLYVLGLHLTPGVDQKCTEERWSASRGMLTVNSRLWSIGHDLQTRRERIGMTYDVHTPTKQFRIQDETVFRSYTDAQMRELLARVPELEWVETFDFRYDLEWPVEINEHTEDVVYILRKK